MKIQQQLILLFFRIYSGNSKIGKESKGLYKKRPLIVCCYKSYYTKICEEKRPLLLIKENIVRIKKKIPISFLEDL